MALEDSLIGVLVGWLLGLASSIYFQDRSVKQQRHETTKEHVYSPLYVEIEENLDRLRDHHNLATLQWIRITRQDYLGYLIEPQDLYEKLRKFYGETAITLNSCIDICQLTYRQSVKNELLSNASETSSISLAPEMAASQAINDVANSVGANLYRGFVYHDDIPVFSKAYDSLKPYSKDLPGTFQEYFEEWKVKSDKDEIIVNYRNVHEQAVNEGEVLRETLGNVLRGNVLRDGAPKNQRQDVPEDHRLRSEERRALVLLGITAILASFLGAMLSVVWTGSKKIEDFYFNIPPASSPVKHATFYWIYILEFMIGFWMVYAFFIFWYFSVDWLAPKIRDTFHVAAAVVMGFYILYISAFIPLTYIVVVWLTDPLMQTIAFSLEIVFIAVLEVDFVKWVTGVGRTAWIPKILRRTRNQARSV